MKKNASVVFAILLTASALLVGCGNAPSTGEMSGAVTESTHKSVSSNASQKTDENQPVTILVAAAASLEYCFTEELNPMFRDLYPWIVVEGTYDSSGKLQTQIEEGLHADVFMSAAIKQMDALVDGNLVDTDTVVNLLENSIVLICRVDSDTAVTSFEDIASAKSIALGDPESVPVGQYAEEALTSLGVWDAVQPQLSLGTNVTEVLHWVAEGSAEVGVVYATDAATTDKVKVITAAPQGSLNENVLYPVGIVSASENKDAAILFLDFLCTPDAVAVFEQYGFKSNP